MKKNDTKVIRQRDRDIFDTLPEDERELLRGIYRSMQDDIREYPARRARRVTSFKVAANIVAVWVLLIITYFNFNPYSKYLYIESNSQIDKEALVEHTQQILTGQKGS